MLKNARRGKEDRATWPCLSPASLRATFLSPLCASAFSVIELLSAALAIASLGTFDCLKKIVPDQPDAPCQRSRHHHIPPPAPARHRLSAHLPRCSRCHHT